MTKKVWYEISATDLACQTCKPGDPDWNKTLQKARGSKFSHTSYSRMYMKEREMVLGNWTNFLLKLLTDHGIKINGEIVVIGINDGQEVHFLPGLISGFDVADGALIRGRKWFPGINFVHMDITSETMQPQSADTYLSFRTVHIFKGDQLSHIITQAYEVLRPGGYAVISIPGGYLDVSGKIVYGQKVEGGIVDSAKPLRDAERLAEEIRKTFPKVDIVNAGIEIFLICRKIKPIRLLVINGSPRQKGNSDILIDWLKDQVTSKYGHTVELTDIKIRSLKDLRFCSACNLCHNQKPNDCSLPDDFSSVLKDKLASSDAVLFVSPVYQGSVTAQIKLVMDRCEVFRKGRLLQGKLCGGVAIGGYPGGGQESTLNQIRIFADITGMLYIPSFGKIRSHLGGYCVAFEKGTITEDLEGLQTALNVVSNMVEMFKNK